MASKKLYQSPKFAWMTLKSSRSKISVQYYYHEADYREEAQDCGFQGLDRTQACSCTSLAMQQQSHFPLITYWNFIWAIGFSCCTSRSPRWGIFFPSPMERHSHFKSEVDERERSGVPLGGNRFCIPGLKRLQQWLVTSSGWDTSWDGFPLVFLADTQAYWVYSAGVCTVWVRWFGKVTVLPTWNCKGCNLLEVLKLFWFKLCLDHWVCLKCCHGTLRVLCI